MSNIIKQLKFTPLKFEEFSFSDKISQLCNLCGFDQVEIAPEIEYLSNKTVKSFCISIFCSSTECRNLAYHDFELNNSMSSYASIDDFIPLPKGFQLTCNLCGSQKILFNASLSQSGFKYVYDQVNLNINCACGNNLKHSFLGKYF